MSHSAVERDPPTWPEHRQGTAPTPQALETGFHAFSEVAGGAADRVRDGKAGGPCSGLGQDEMRVTEERRLGLESGKRLRISANLLWAAMASSPSTGVGLLTRRGVG